MIISPSMALLVHYVLTNNNDRVNDKLLLKSEGDKGSSAFNQRRDMINSSFSAIVNVLWVLLPQSKPT